jgi:hypothetical protein
MAITSDDSSLHIVEGPAVDAGEAVPAWAEVLPQSGDALQGRGGMTLDGGVLACPCPDCRAPMSIRLWLMTADCWLCGTSIELTLEQQQEAERLLKASQQTQETPAKAQPTPARRQEQPRAAPVEARVRENGRPTRPTPPVETKTKPIAPCTTPPPAPQTQPRTTSTPTRSAPQSYAHGALPSAQRPANPWNDLTAWLISAVFHAVLIILLGLWTFPGEEEHRAIVLSASLSHLHREGGVESEDSFNENEFELPVDIKPKDKNEREALIKADQDARELRLDLPEAARNLPEISRVKADLKSSDPYRRMQAARDPRVRSEVVRREGGTTLTEAAVARALRWIARQQNDDGSWSLHRSGGGIRSDTSGTSMALMAMLGTGQTHRVGRYRDEVAGGLSWLLKNQKPNGDLRAGSSGNSGMYAHGQAAIALCDAFKVTGDETLRAPAQRAIEFICQAQHRQGGWRYSPGEAGDLSVVGWQLMALHSAKAAYLNVPRQHLLLAENYLDSVQKDRQGGQYAYQRGRPATPAMTAEGLLSRMYLGWDREQEGLSHGVDYLVRNHLPDKKSKNIYYWYYGTQVMHHWGGPAWEKWNRAMRDALVTTQETSGKDAGSWSPSGHPHGSAGGRLYVTALSACTLEVYYRYAPLYWRIELD